ncbi:hypothetical protein [Lysobacter niastensis]|uniref:Uncharacterized protein n=1 Tax=Lysobacter niastensis TaxID=380629 RepID=A0ABS0B891_9GAMM|nr:hypothetical protein [Lysobacter niastensis]MBF6023219.1 hypothetical protein [Lysobacter niastensis]
MQLFKNECLTDTGFAAFDLEFFRTPAFGPRYARRSGAPRAFALSSARQADTDDDAVVLDWRPIEREYLRML